MAEAMHVVMAEDVMRATISLMVVAVIGIAVMWIAGVILCVMWLAAMLRLRAMLRRTVRCAVTACGSRGGRGRMRCSSGFATALGSITTFVFSMGIGTKRQEGGRQQQRARVVSEGTTID